MVNYLDSRRIAGTTAERSSIPTSATYGGWVELGRTTLGSAGDTIDVTSLANKRYLMVLSHEIASGVIYPQAHLNGDMDAIALNYASRRSGNGGADLVLTDRNEFFVGGGVGTTTNFSVDYISNYATKEKLGIRHTVFQGAAGATTAPSREEIVGKHEQTTNPISSFKEYNVGGGDYDTGSEVVVLGWDPSDTHTTNFWTELDNVTQSSDATTFVSNTFTNKKYLWIQAWLDIDSTYQVGMRFNNDSSQSYSTRYSDNGGGDGTLTSQTSVTVSSDQNTPRFVNMFIINEGTNEPLVIGHLVDAETSGAGTAPRRREFVAKCDTTTAITSIQFVKFAGAGDHILQNSFIKVWGSD